MVLGSNNKPAVLFLRRGLHGAQEERGAESATTLTVGVKKASGGAMVETVERASTTLAHWTTWVTAEVAVGTGRSRASGAALTDTAERLEKLLMVLIFLFRPNGQTGIFCLDVAVRLSRE